MNRARTTQDGDIVAEICRAVPDAAAIYRFGSSACGTTRPDSDIDIALLAAAPLDPIARFDLQERLASRLGRDVDLVDLRRASPVLAMQVITSGGVVYDGNPEARGAFEDRVFGSYARLNEERRGILERIAAEGTVHGR